MQRLMLRRKKKNHRPRATDILEGFLRDFKNETVTLADILNLLGHSAFGIVIFVLALANILIANLPGMSTILGLPIMLISLQMIWGAQRPWLPKYLAEKQFKRENFEKIVHRSVAVLRKLEIFIKPRMLFIVVKNDRILGAICFTLSLVLALPILFGNWLPAWGLALIALGMVERDGLVTLIGFIFGLAACAYAIAFFMGLGHLAIAVGQEILRWVTPA